MKERIRELAEQAGGNPNYKAFRGHFLPPPPDYIDPATVDLERFAELIVRECMSIAQEYDGAKLGGPGLIIAMRIEQHFGVRK